MAHLSAPVIVANEIVKAADFNYGYEQSIKNVSAVLNDILSNPAMNMIIGGKVKPYHAGGMNVSIAPVYVHCGTTGVDVIESEIREPVSLEVSFASQDRIDIIQVRGIEESFDFQDRKLRDAETGIETIVNMATKKRIVLDVNVKKGTIGSVEAPQTDSGYVKLAEVFVNAGDLSITEQNIRNVTAKYEGAQNTKWTNQKNGTFNPGYITDIVTKFLVAHNENGMLKPETVLASMIKFGVGLGDVNKWG